MKAQRKGWAVCAVFIMLLIVQPLAKAEIIEVVFQESFEFGQGNWEISNGVWQVGAPTVGPNACHGGNQCVGTALDGNYHPSIDSRLITPETPTPITLPSVSENEEIHLRFWQWFSYGASDAGFLQISEYDAGTGWSGWSTLGLSALGGSKAWSRKDVDLTQYAGKQIRIAFFHVAVDTESEVDGNSGWYIDDVEVLKLVPEFTGDFEDGWGDWSAETGVWQVGVPEVNVGPGVCRAGFQCAGTILDGVYDEFLDSRLVSPALWLPDMAGDEGNALRFWHWFSYSTGDLGYVQISVYDSVTGWSNWTNIGGPYTGDSNVWSSVTISLTAYSGSRIRLAFSHNAVNALPGVDESSGWYVDQVRLPGVYLNPCEGDFDNDGDVDGSDLEKLGDNFGRANCSLDDFCTGDFDNDGDVDGTDLAKFSEDFGNTAGQCFLTP